jgi:hypothetical protein
MSNPYRAISISGDPEIESPTLVTSIRNASYAEVLSWA